MECKYDWNIVTRYGTYELIETLWNVNTVLSLASAGAMSELIETLWNVNCRTLLNYNHGSGELIETLWNVNKHWFKGFLDSDADMN